MKTLVLEPSQALHIENITKPLQILYQIRKLITKFCIICNDPAADRTFFFYIFHFIKDGQDHRCFLFETLGTSKYLSIGSNNKLRNYKFEFSWLIILLTCCLFGFFVFWTIECKIPKYIFRIRTFGIGCWIGEKSVVGMNFSKGIRLCYTLIRDLRVDFIKPTKQ